MVRTFVPYIASIVDEVFQTSRPAVGREELAHIVSRLNVEV